MLPPSSGFGGINSSTPFAPFPTPLAGMRTRELHGTEYYHLDSPTDAGYAEQMRAMCGREEEDMTR